MPEHPWVPDNMVVDWERPHLGGYLSGSIGDVGSYCAPVWAWLLKKYKVHSMIDVGCGEGHALRWFAARGCRVLGVEGIAQPDKRIVEHDYTLGPYRPRGRFDLAWCCEFVEHVEAQFLDNFMVTLAKAKIIAMTHALPWQGGHHHVNCQPEEYWLNVLGNWGYRINRPATRYARTLHPGSYFDWSGLIFMR